MTTNEQGAAGRIEDGRATKSKSAFRMEYAVRIGIRSEPARIWALLTRASDYPSWNSTIESIEGEMKEGERIRLRARIAPGREFKLRVRRMVPDSTMVWSDGFAPMFTGVRTYTLTPREDGSSEFAMTEVFSGVMLPMIAKALPDFTEAFEQFAADLKEAAERSN